MIIELTRHSIILITPASRLVLHVYSTACYVTMKKYPTKSAQSYNFECTSPTNDDPCTPSTRIFVSSLTNAQRLVVPGLRVRSS